MEKLIGLRLADPAFSMIEEMAIADTRTTASMARRLLLERLAEIAVQRQLAADNSAGAAAA
ncbi:hypothetical protein UP10_14505 [Bradyrhizobium sp. LTSPM299]|uniref:hypothetical protein n=1 Tax=Bradyrhizobium sp. LTSPM299 TaxID=1619233 RepID=UPI0005CA9C32|nr:hypothetical protein [Bradyrhizobium sp. LTSPM299]KJC59904.1 hypothetical protein UP10_14505 [Bradyrhizobium sp. LTSPM299]